LKAQNFKTYRPQVTMTSKLKRELVTTIWHLLAQLLLTIAKFFRLYKIVYDLSRRFFIEHQIEVSDTI